MPIRMWTSTLRSDLIAAACKILHLQAADPSELQATYALENFNLWTLESLSSIGELAQVLRKMLHNILLKM